MYLEEIFNTGFKIHVQTHHAISNRPSVHIPVMSIHLFSNQLLPPPFISNRYLNIAHSSPPSKPSSLFLVQRSQQ